MEEAEALLVAADLVAVRQWWLEERQLVLVCQLVKTVVMCQSVRSPSQTEDFQRSLKELICCVMLSSPVAEKTIVMCQSVGSPSQTEDSRRSLKELICCVMVSSPVAEKTVVMCQSVGSPSQTEDSRRSLKELICCVMLSSPVAEITDVGLLPPSLLPALSVAVVVTPLSLWPPSPPCCAGYLPLCPPAQIPEHCQWELLSSSLFCLS